MPAERQYPANNGRHGGHAHGHGHGHGHAAVVATRERVGVSGTPSRKERHRESSAVQDPGLKDYVRCSLDIDITFSSIVHTIYVCICV